MGISDDINQPPEGKSRPSLFHKGQIDIENNVLDAMAGRRNARPVARPQRRIWLLVPLMMAAGWWVSTLLKPATTHKPEVQAAATTAPPAPTALSVPTTQANEAQAVSNSALSEVKTLVTTSPQSDTPAPAQAATPNQAPAPAPSPQVQSTPTAAIPPKATAKPPAPTPTARPQKSEPAKTASNGKASNNTNTGNKTAAEKSTPAPKTASSKPASSETIQTATKAVVPATKKAAGPDPDVELLGAIMRHMGKDSDVAPATAVPTRSVQTIADLVKSCKAKDSAEALNCQRRICEGSWGKAQACPANLAPNLTAKATTGSSASPRADNAAAPSPAPTVINEANAPARP